MGFQNVFTAHICLQGELNLFAVKKKRNQWCCYVIVTLAPYLNTSQVYTLVNDVIEIKLFYQLWRHLTCSNMKETVKDTNSKRVELKKNKGWLTGAQGSEKSFKNG